MSRSKVAAALTLVVALSFAVPALAGSASPIKVAKKALGLAKKADKRSRTALKRANTANTNAKNALAKLATAQPEAVHAQNADHATNADKAAAAAALDGLTVLGRVRAQPTNGADSDSARVAAPEILLFTRGALRVYGKCFSYNNGNPAVEAHVYIGTSQNGVIFAGEGNSDSGNAYLNTDTPESDRELQSQSSQDSVGSLNSGDAGDGEFYAFAPDGTVLQGHVYVAAKQGNPAVGDGPIGPGSGCLFTGRAFGS
jgi:hypothetical protein